MQPNRDLKPNDLRLKLIQHASNPDGLRPKSVEKSEHKLNSELERQLYDTLAKAKYHVIIGVPVGEFVLDLVAIGQKGNRVAFQCDGDREVTREALEASLYRQMTLERLGWSFIRVRGSEFLRHPEETMKKIQKRLKKFEIEPLGMFSTDPQKQEEQREAQSKELLQQVIDRARNIQAHWKDVPSVSSVIKNAGAPQAAAEEKEDDDKEEKEEE